MPQGAVGKVKGQMTDLGQPPPYSQEVGPSAPLPPADQYYIPPTTWVQVSMNIVHMYVCT